MQLFAIIDVINCNSDAFQLMMIFGCFVGSKNPKVFPFSMYMHMCVYQQQNKQQMRH